MYFLHSFDHIKLVCFMDGLSYHNITRCSLNLFPSKDFIRISQMTNQAPYRVVIADDHAMFREGLKWILTKECQLNIVAEACDGLALLDLMEKLETEPHLAVLDLSMPNLGGIETTARIKSKYPKTRVLILTMHREDAYIQSALAAGANGYLLKGDSGSDMMHAVTQILKGQTFISPSVSFPR